RRTLLTYSRIGRVISRYGESRILSGTGRSWASHASWSSADSSGSTPTVTASMVDGRVARAYERARNVGLWILETSTMAWLRGGSATSSPVTTSSAATRS